MFSVMSDVIKLCVQEYSKIGFHYFIFYRKPSHYGMALALGLWHWPSLALIVFGLGLGQLALALASSVLVLLTLLGNITISTINNSLKQYPTRVLFICAIGQGQADVTLCCLYK